MRRKLGPTVINLPFMAAIVAAMLACSFAHADKITKTDGTVIEGTIVRDMENEGTITVDVHGSELRIPRLQIASIDREVQQGATDQAVANAQSALAANDPGFFTSGP